MSLFFQDLPKLYHEKKVHPLCDIIDFSCGFQVVTIFPTQTAEINAYIC